MFKLEFVVEILFEAVDIQPAPPLILVGNKYEPVVITVLVIVLIDGKLKFSKLPHNELGKAIDLIKPPLLLDDEGLELDCESCISNWKSRREEKKDKSKKERIFFS